MPAKERRLELVQPLRVARLLLLAGLCSAALICLLSKADAPIGVDGARIEPSRARAVTFRLDDGANRRDTPEKRFIIQGEYELGLVKRICVAIPADD